jgi:DNA-binding NarL/FixJ family response regulator
MSDERLREEAADMTDPTTAPATEPVARPRVVLVDDHGMFRAGVRAEIGAAVDIVGEAATVEDAISTIGRTAPDVVLLDVHLPAGGGPAVVSAVLRTTPGTRFLALSVSDAAEDVISVIRSGARGYVTKTISGPDLIDAIRRVADGDVVFSPRLAGFVLDAFRDGDGGAGAARSADPELDQLTPREQEVLRLLARGYSYREIGSELFISIKTVETHASNVLRKLQLSSRHQLTRWAAERRIV